MKTSDVRGFTLVEFLVAITILVVGLLGLLQTINMAMDKNIENVFRTEAVMLADERMMMMRNRSFVSLSTTSADPPKILQQRVARGILKNYSVQETIGQATEKSKEIIVGVYWKKRDKQYSHTVSTVVTTF